MESEESLDDMVGHAEDVMHCVFLIHTMSFLNYCIMLNLFFTGKSKASTFLTDMYLIFIEMPYILIRTYATWPIFVARSAYIHSRGCPTPFRVTLVLEYYWKYLKFFVNSIRYQLFATDENPHIDEVYQMHLG